MKRNLVWMFPNILFVLGLLLFQPPASYAASPIYAYGYCVTTDGTSVFLVTPCVDSDPAQSWFWAPEDKLRNARFPNKCLHIESGTFTSMNHVILHPCRDANYQQWFKSDASKPSGRLKAGNSSMCLTVAGGSYRPGKILVLYACQQSVAQIWVWQSIPNMTNQTTADWAALKTNEGSALMPNFHQFLDCENDKPATRPPCKLTRQTGPPWGYGFFAGPGQGGASASETLDFGDVHTLDRCSWAHDSNYWNLHTTCGQNVAYRRCLDKVVAGTTDELTALKEVKIKYDVTPWDAPPEWGGGTLGCPVVSDSITGTLPPK